MLWPFSRQRMVLPKSHPEILPTVIADLVQRDPDFQGTVTAATDESAYTILVHQGNAAQHVLAFNDGSFVASPPLPLENILLSLGDAATILAAELDQVVAATMATVFARPPDLLTDGREPVREILEHAVTRSDLFVVTVLHRFVAMPAIFEQGAMVQWIRFDAPNQSFVVEGSQDAFLAYCAANQDDIRFAFHFTPYPLQTAIGIKELDDSFLRTAKSYIALFDQICAMLVRDLKGRAMGEVQKLLNALKKRYPPLYQGLFVNPETLQINWERLLENRRKISHRYRYDLFFVYLDELLVLLIRLHDQLIGVRGRVELIRFIEQRRRGDMLRPTGLLRNFYGKLNTLVRIDRVGVPTARE